MFLNKKLPGIWYKIQYCIIQKNYKVIKVCKINIVYYTVYKTEKDVVGIHKNF